MSKRTCSIDTCEDPVVGRGWCSRHYQAWRKYGDPLAGGHKTGRRRGVCSIKDCDEVRAGLGWCQAHYTMWRRHGDPEWKPEPGARRIYALDDHFFDIIDTEAKAYWLGFITADGCVQVGKAGANGWARNHLYVKLKSSDAGHLEKLKADLAAENPVRHVPQAGRAGSAADISFTSVRLTEALIRLGVTPRKSLTVRPWSGPAHLMRHYWRGMVDGDGSIGKHAGADKWYLKLVGTSACVEAFRDWAAPLSGSAARIRPKDNIWSWTAGGLASPQAIARAMYEDATVYLDRKHALALQLMATPVRHRTWLAQGAPAS